MTNHNETTVEAVKAAIRACIEAGDIPAFDPTGLATVYEDVIAHAALAAIPEPATVGGVTREQILGVIHANIGYNITDLDRAADAILALFPPAPSTVPQAGQCGNTQVIRCWSFCELPEGHAGDCHGSVSTGLVATLAPSAVGTVEELTEAIKTVWRNPLDKSGDARWLAEEILSILTPATTRDVGATRLRMVAGFLSVELKELNGSHPEAIYDALVEAFQATGITVLRPASTKGDGK